MAKKQFATEEELSALRNELTGAVYSIQGLLAGANALAEDGIEIVAETEAPVREDLLFQIVHCIRSAQFQLKAMGARIEIATAAIQNGKPIGDAVLIRDGM